MQQQKTDRDLALINPNWAAFVLLVTLLSIFNGLVIFLLPLSEDAQLLIGYVNLGISLVLWADFIYLLRSSPDKRYFLTAQYGWMVLLGSIPALRFLRLIWFWIALRANKRSLREFLSRIVIKQDAQGTLLFIVFITIVIFEFAIVAILSVEEASPGGTINSVSDAIWWAFSTVTTVGYGDEVPVTNAGRLIAMLLMAIGIALFSVLTGWLAEWFRSQQERPSFADLPPQDLTPAQAVIAMRVLLEKQENAYQETINELRARLDDLESRF